ncbi:uncharacterized protein E5676_scaffold1278G00090 [Cucumis melo var. makuwa]|uniref:SWIM-type domain-containing protein n=1 Tax=Cucumis melo var. makuwa TaxID=1194695 RepID=A0A5D3BD68_CUCMM|nr:uncharacterized protein E5676_scaffold1278G00090 [Cucumis melo var. makuwa]
MVKLAVIVFHSGQWDEQQSYVDYKTNCVLVDEVISSFDSFVNLIRTEIQVESCIELSVLLPIGSNSVQHVLKIVENKDVTWFLTLVKDQSTQYPLVAHSVNTVLDASVGSSCSSSIVEVDLGDELVIFRDVDITNSKDGLTFKEKDLFCSKEILLKSFRFIAVKSNFEFKTLRSNSRSIELRCNEDGCLWFVRASRYKRSELWMIRKYVSDHSCSMIVHSSHKQASSEFVSHCMIDYLRYSYSHSTPKDIIHHMRMNYGVSVSYYKAWRAKESVMKLLKGDADDSYALIPKFFSKLKEINPGSFTAYEIDPNGHFKYCFMAIASSIEGWRYCRPNIAVDGTFLKCKYGGTLLTAATMDDDFELYMRWMESIYPSIRGYLMKVGFERWSRAYSRKRRYQIMTTNICESLNSKLKIDRDLPVASLLEAIREFLQRWFYERRKAASCLKSVLSSWAEGLIRKLVDESRSFIVNPVSEVEFQVVDGGKNFLVKLNCNSCSCLFWDLEEIPCAHALIVIRSLNLNPYAFVSQYYYATVLSATYGGLVRPIGNHTDWSVVGVNDNILPPVFRRPAGRPRKRRIPSIGEVSKSSKCSRCKRASHNIRTCRFEPI